MLRLLPLLLLLAGCGRYFAGPLIPVERQGAYTTVQDDGSVLYAHDRLEISLRPMTDEELNRQFASCSSRGPESTNPYTYGNWKPMGDRWTPQRFTVFRLRVSNYAYPKVLVDPCKAVLTSANGRRYRALCLRDLLEYYRSYALGQAGNAWARFEERKDILKKTLYPGDALFSGQASEGYIVFPPLDYDVKEVAVTLRDIVLRFDYQGRPIETMDLTFRFRRDVYKGYYPPPSLVEGR